MKTHHTVLLTSTILGVLVGLAILLRPSTSISPLPELAAPEHIPAAARAVIKTKMLRHGQQMTDLVGRLVVLDYDGAARAAGAIYDEPVLARPVNDDDLNRYLPARFFELQDAIRVQARQLVTVAAQRDSTRLADGLGALTKSCIACHDLYLHERAAR